MELSIHRNPSKIASPTRNGSAAENFSVIQWVPPECLNRLVMKAEESSRLRRPVEDEEWRHHLDGAQAVIAHAGEPLLTRIANHISRLIDELDPLMTTYCGLTCPTCCDRCCDGRKVFFNGTDLIYLAALGEASVPGQTRLREGQSCRYLSRSGCLLSRRIRPYVCVWFLCEPQMELLGLEPARHQRTVTETLQEIRRARLLLESLYESCSA